MNTAKFFKEIAVTDPDSDMPVEIDIFKHEQSGGIFGVDASYLDQNFDNDEDIIISDPLNKGQKVLLTGI
jgi:hypothetical protein